MSFATDNRVNIPKKLNQIRQDDSRRFDSQNPEHGGIQANDCTSENNEVWDSGGTRVPESIRILAVLQLK
jgi:hypothetical protein